jgi:6-pyruvoyltetrahydropterin/6-carboxytetrahydropterin synthase
LCTSGYYSRTVLSAYFSFFIAITNPVPLTFAGYIPHLMEISVSRKAHFNAAHRLHLPQWSEEKNRAFFGSCNNANYHGHNYELIVTVTGKINPETGYLIDMKVLKDAIKEEVEDRFDHKNLNLDTEEFKDINPTAEYIAIVIWRLLRKRIDAVLKLKVTLFETERNFVEYTGND